MEIAESHLLFPQYSCCPNFGFLWQFCGQGRRLDLRGSQGRSKRSRRTSHRLDLVAPMQSSKTFGYQSYKRQTEYV